MDDPPSLRFLNRKQRHLTPRFENRLETETMFLKERNAGLARFSASLASALQNISTTQRSRKQVITASVDAGLVIFSLWLAYSLRHGLVFSAIKPNLHLFLGLPVVTVLIFALLGVYKWVLRTGNERLYIQLVKGGMLSSFSLLAGMFLFPPSSTAPRSLFFIYGLIFIILTMLVRRVWQQIHESQNNISYGDPVAIYGAGRAGRELADLLKLQKLKIPKVFIDDDPLLAGSTIAGLPVINGSNETIKHAIDTYQINEFIIALPSVKGKAYIEVYERVSDFNLPVLTIPSVGELISNQRYSEQLREISMNDLLGRSEIKPDYDLLSKCVTAKNILITGGGGSIGSEICRQIIKLKPSKLVVLEQSEENLYHITEELTVLLNNETGTHFSFIPVLGSITNREKVQRVIKDNEIHTVYHAAAYKHVPIVEEYPEEAIFTNILGTQCVLDAAIDCKVKNFTLISTDKAVRPTNYMGASKRVAEMILQAKADLPHQTTICMVRFGNVLGSSGSVVPKFKQQIMEGGPLTITHPEITRYFMTIPEASQLVLQASALAEGGEVFVLDMGEPVKIMELAKAMIKFAGKEVLSKPGDKNGIEIRIEGLRPGEKMHEELFIGRNIVQTNVKKILVAREEYLSWKELESVLTMLKSPTVLSTHQIDILRNLTSYTPVKPKQQNKHNIVYSKDRVTLTDKEYIEDGAVT